MPSQTTKDCLPARILTPVVSDPLINTVESVSNHNFVNTVLSDKNDYYIVSPDAGVICTIALV